MYLNKEAILLGVWNKDLINHIIIAIKRYIYIKRFCSGIIGVNGALQYIIHQYKMDTYIVNNEKRLLKWECLKDLVNGL